MQRISGKLLVKTHVVKCWPAYFPLVVHGIKQFEIRKNDRDYKPGDLIKQKEWNPETSTYTGKSVIHEIGYILKGGKFGLKKGYVAMQLKPAWNRQIDKKN